MSPLPLLLAAALLAEPVPTEPEPAPVVAPVPIELPPGAHPTAPAPRYRLPGDRLFSFAGGMGVGRYDDIPIAFVLVRGSIVALKATPEGRGARPGFGVSIEAFGGRTQRGLPIGGFTLGPGLWIAQGPMRAGAAVELGFHGVETATNRIAEFMLVGLVRATGELELWQGPTSTVFVGVSGWIGGAPPENGSDQTAIPMRAASAFLGVRL